MDIIYILVPLSIVLISIATLIFFWAVRSGQFDDLESPAHKILFDDDPEETTASAEKPPSTTINPPPAAPDATSPDKLS
ncbi:cbb3-type cytochrome oxidase assembly protein CcoS [Candidatus Thalassolituus haligoni]|jgi:cbb3-type cytochrome oxidase maturation protein|uniref:cbb3-type cytochrome oxidase assembly protein CcoS n=1 Tax=Candidatus Thalassolituus haligoni TaxID=3100113 RepID=UPI003518676E|tara:strand:+ start:5957 stop:6193 length:237 start_codon:yes stop_codon:yes gene_type:complete